MPIDDFLHDYLVDLRKRQDENRKFAGNVYNNDYIEYVCVNELGRLLLPNYVTKKFKELLQDKNLRVIRLHDLRHSCASLLLHLGYNMKRCSALARSRRYRYYDEYIRSHRSVA